VVELKSDAFPQKVLNKLFKYTELQKTFHLNMLALTEGIQPQTLSLKQVLTHFFLAQSSKTLKHKKARSCDLAFLCSLEKVTNQNQTIIF
jgi:DNA gyrase/topoisomerase IV subunit A